MRYADMPNNVDNFAARSDRQIPRPALLISRWPSGHTFSTTLPVAPAEQRHLQKRRQTAWNSLSILWHWHRPATKVYSKCHLCTDHPYTLVAVPPSLAPGRFKKWWDFTGSEYEPRFAEKHDGSCHRFRNYVPLYRGPSSLQSQKSRSWLDEIMLW